MTRTKIDSLESLKETVLLVRRAEDKFANYTQEQVDKIFFAASIAADKERISLAKLAVQETGMGVLEDKVIKNHYAAEYIYNAYRDEKTCGIIEYDSVSGLTKIAEPLGIIAAVIPTTNPTSTVIFKILLALKTRNAIIISAHPRARESTARTAEIMLDAAVRAGAPENIIAWIDTPSIELTSALMKSEHIDLVLATGGPGMVKAAYSSGNPAIGVGAGNTPIVIHKSANIILAVSSIIHSKTFDNGLICASEQSVIVAEEIYDQVKQEFIKRNCYFLNPEEINKLRKIMIIDGKLNSKIVGQKAYDIAKMADINIPKDIKILIGEVTDYTLEEAFAYEKLSPILAMYKYQDFKDAQRNAEKLIEEGGYGHTVGIYLDENQQAQDLKDFSSYIKTGRVLVNMPSSQGAIGDLYNFKLPPSLTLGCGSWGGNSVSENIGVKHLLNIKTVAGRRENMLWFRTPQKIYLNQGSVITALDELKNNKSRVFIVTDKFLFKNNYTKIITDKLDSLKISYKIFFDINPDPDLESAKLGAKEMQDFEPDCIIAVGGGSAMDAGKIMWVLYEHPDVNFQDMAMRFMDIRKRVYKFPVMGKKAYFIAIPTSSGTGSEVTPFAVITENKIKYPLADYELLPNMSIIDVNMMLDAPKSLTAISGIDAVTHALEAYVSVMATDYTDALALGALKNIFKYLPRAYQNGAQDLEAREKMANAATMAGMAFANAFLGVCHSMAHKLGSFHGLPHGLSNALMITSVMRFNASEAPEKMGTFPKYSYPNALARYAEIADYLKLEGKTDQEKLESLINLVEDLKSKIQIKKTIRDYEIPEEEFLNKLDAMTEQAFDDQCTGTNPRYPLLSEIKNMYLEAYYGKQNKQD